jgi:flavin reductase (DIM6/NTAB) family NADH-FMN oxidoreductase RutF/rubredoxin
MAEEKTVPIEFQALNAISYGLYVVASQHGGRRNGQIGNTVMQVTSDPVRIAVCINKTNFTHELIMGSDRLSISVLEQDTPMEMIGLFGFKSGRDVDKLASVRAEQGASGVPVVLDHAVAVIEARVRSHADTGTHTLFVCDVLAARHIKDAVPLTYDDYKRIKKGLVPRTAPSYQPPAKAAPAPAAQEGKKAMTSYVCGVCGHVYDPAKGEPDTGIPPGTAFEDLPADWTCPVCGAAKSEFSPKK